MNKPEFDAEAAWRAAAKALRARAPELALNLFNQIKMAGKTDPSLTLGIAMANRDIGNYGEELRVLDELLEGDPRNIRALSMKADHYMRKGDVIAASIYFRAVMRIVESTPGLPADLRDEGARAARAATDLNNQYERFLTEHLISEGMGGAGTDRVKASLDPMFGKTEIFLQQPQQYYLPGLPQIQFYSRDATPWLTQVEAATDDIIEELSALLEDGDKFTPYVEKEKDRPFFDTHGLLDDPGWSAIYLYKGGTPVEENAAKCPKTLSILKQCPLCNIPGRTPSILFSLLRPGAKIPPHHGLLNTRLICHLPLIVPDGCGFRVGNETRLWAKGNGFAFDDSIEHEAWNMSDRPRIILIFDVWKPELTAIERKLISATLLASDAYRGVQTSLEV